MDSVSPPGKAGNAGTEIFGYGDESLVVSVCPYARVVPERILRRISRERHSLVEAGRVILHDQLAVITDEDVLGLIDDDELHIDPLNPRPHCWILLRKFHEREIENLSVGERRRELWRRLFHGQIDHSLLSRRLMGQWRRSLVRAWQEDLGESTLKEIRTVLLSDRMLLSEASDAQLLAEFAAVFLELKWFEPEALPLVFPGLEQLDPAAIDWIESEVAGARLFESSRIPEATIESPWLGLEWITEQWGKAHGEPHDGAFHEHSIKLEKQAEQPSVEPNVLAGSGLAGTHAKGWFSLLQNRALHQLLGGAGASESRFQNAVEIGLKAEQSGNYVGAARWFRKAVRYGRRVKNTTETGVHPDSPIARLASSLADALNSPADAPLWRFVLVKIFQAESGGFWTRNSRLLYDLQKVVDDYEKPVYVMDWAGFLMSFGKETARKPLPDIPHVLMLRHLRSALNRLPRLQVDESVKRILRRLLQRSIHQSEERFRQYVRPILEKILTEAGLVPANMPEKVGFSSLVDELIDTVVTHGYFGLSQLRDTISRNNIKLKDLEGIGQWWSGDNLLQADRTIEKQLPGIYHEGEIYLRALQRASSAVFAQPLGRKLTWYIILPFLGAFMLMGGLFFIPEEINHWVLSRVDLHISVPEAINPLKNPPNVFFVGLFMLGMIHHRRFRNSVLQSLRRTGIYLRGLLWDWPRRVLAAPIIKLVFGNKWFILSWKWIFKPLLFTFVIYWFIPEERMLRRGQLVTSLAGIYLAMMAAVNSRAGRDLQEHLGEWLKWFWQRFGFDLVVAFYRFVIDVFDRLSETVNRALYAVDELIRYRRRSGPLVEFTSGLLGFLWGVLLYVFRFVFNLLVEPQINPIKHFPVVTVSHKFLLPMIPVLAGAIRQFYGDDPKTALSLATVIMSVIPGAIGFIVWELKENWKLYEANRPRDLLPRAIGHHGESMHRLLYPGFHSGTIPKLLHRIRRTRLKALRTRRMYSLVSQTQKLHHVFEALSHFVEREFVRVLNSSVMFREHPVHLSHLGVTNLSVTFELKQADDQLPFVICLKSESGWTVADILQNGWTDDLDHEHWQMVRVALAGFLAQSGVDLSETQITHSGLIRPLTRVMVDHEGLVIFPDPLYHPNERFFYDLTVTGEIVPRTKSLSDPFAILNGILPERPLTEIDEPWPAIDSRSVNMKQTPVTWSEWVGYWGKGGRPGRLPERARLNFLPRDFAD